MTKAFALNLSMKALFFHFCKGKRPPKLVRQPHEPNLYSLY